MMNEHVGDPCADNPCLNGGSCIPNSFGGFTCQCTPGYSGQRCEDRKGILFSYCMFYVLLCQTILVLLNHAWIKALAYKKMVDFVVYVRQDILGFDVKFVMHVKVILVWMEEHASLSMEMVVINVCVPMALVGFVVKQVCLFTLKEVFLLLE